MNVLVNRGERDGRDALSDASVHLFRTGVARHGLHDLVENLALVGGGDPVIFAKFTEGTRPGAGRDTHEELVNDKYYRFVKRG